VELRHCLNCNYDLTGLAVEGNLATCPECAYVNDFSIPFTVRKSRPTPVVSPICVAAIGALLWFIEPRLWIGFLTLMLVGATTWYFLVVVPRSRAWAGKCPSCGYYLGGIEPGSPCPGCKRPAPPIVPDP